MENITDKQLVDELFKRLNLKTKSAEKQGYDDSTYKELLGDCVHTDKKIIDEHSEGLDFDAYYDVEIAFCFDKEKLVKIAVLSVP